MKRRTVLTALSAVAAAGGLGSLVFAAIAWHTEIAPIAPPKLADFDPAIIRQGAALAAIGDCVVCHTATQGPAFAGGRALETPFGTLYATNITPDERTGIGNWSADAFRRAMRDGVSRDGEHLYPALPYEHFTRVTDADLDAIYAFLMTRAPVPKETPENRLIPPLGFRPLLAGWKLLFLHDDPVLPVAGQSDEWNRGRYLVEGFGHCGGCHTPRNIAGGEERGKPFAGGIAEGWDAPPLNAANRTAHPWTVDAVYRYLRTGMDAEHGIANGPMGPVAHGLSGAPEDDVRSIAIYVASLLERDGRKPDSLPPVDREADATREHPEGAALFAGACATCHGPGAPMMAQGRPSLSFVSALQADHPRNAVQAVVNGLPAAQAGRTALMPPFQDSLTDAQIGQVMAYLRSRYSKRQPWTGLEDAVEEARSVEEQP
mgnify:CR=1 FL=1